MTNAPGWYPDPHTPGLRWWDGVQWTGHVQPAQPPALTPWTTSPPPPANHLLHLALTVLTFGLWAPVWILVAVSANRAQASYWQQVNAGSLQTPGTVR